MYEFPRELWEELIDEMDVWDNYSGRHMYGERCIGVVGDMSAVLRFVARVATWNPGGEHDGPEGIDLADALINAVRSDNMGTDMIFYFPGFKVENE